MHVLYLFHIFAFLVHVDMHIIQFKNHINPASTYKQQVLCFSLYKAKSSCK